MSPEDVAARVEGIFAAAGAYREGHFELKSGRHGDRYIEKFRVLQWPAHVADLCRLMIERVSGPIDVVVGPTTGGVILAYECARQLGVRGIFAEQVTGATGQPARALRRGFRIAVGERVLVVDDVVTTGSSLLEMVPLVEESGGVMAGLAVLVDRSGGLREVISPRSGAAYTVSALWTLDLPTYAPRPADCPGCSSGLPLEAPGSSGAA